MTFQDLSRDPKSARQTLVEATGTPFAPSPEVRPVVGLIDGRRTHEDVEPEDWIRALEVSEGAVAVYFELAADHEWWLAYDADPNEDRYDDEYGLSGPYHLWTTYPSGPWEHSTQTRQIFQSQLEMLYWRHVPDEERTESDIYRSKVVRLEDAPRFVRQGVRGENR